MVQTLRKHARNVVEKKLEKQQQQMKPFSG
jgi:hypothetical protein